MVAYNVRKTLTYHIHSNNTKQDSNSFNVQYTDLPTLIKRMTEVKVPWSNQKNHLWPCQHWPTRLDPSGNGTASIFFVCKLCWLPRASRRAVSYFQLITGWRCQCWGCWQSMAVSSHSELTRCLCQLALVILTTAQTDCTVTFKGRGWL
jgi:hypothetical protein